MWQGIRKTVLQVCWALCYIVCYLYRAGKKHQQAMKVAQQKAVARKKYKVPEGLPMPSYMASIDETFDTTADPSSPEDISNPNAEKWNTSNFSNVYIRNAKLVTSHLFDYLETIQWRLSPSMISMIHESDYSRIICTIYSFDYDWPMTIYSCLAELWAISTEIDPGDLRVFLILE